jgi:hypothetical protein
VPNLPAVFEFLAAHRKADGGVSQAGMDQRLSMTVR